MAINKNHEFEDLNGVKCAIVEKNVGQERVDFLKALLELNKYTVVIVPSAPAKPAPAVPAKPAPAPTTEGTPDTAPAATAPATDNTSIETPAAPPAPTTFTVGVTDVSFNAINAIFGRLLKTSDGHIVTLAYWQQKETTSRDEIPYFEKNDYKQ